MARNPATIAFWRGRLPHWEVADGRYFVTLHLQGAIPERGVQEIRACSADLERLAQHDRDGRLRVQRQIFAAMEAWLDQATLVRHLEHQAVAAMVIEAIRFRQGRDWRMYEYVLMPNHLHLFFEIDGKANANAGRLKQVLEQFKRWTGHQAGQLLGLDGARFWQDEWFDHWSRSDEEDERIIGYIRQNPVKARLVSDYQQWPYGSWAK
ncbi:MAG TPA: hypothetical protein VL096_06320 [Pirellulaceae bacterium]|nr:hypothetical protein [Pirellulaceae bacterium]